MSSDHERQYPDRERAEADEAFTGGALFQSESEGEGGGAGEGPAGAGRPAGWLRPALAAAARRRVPIVFSLLFIVQALILLAGFFPAPHNGGDNAGYLALAHSLVERGAYVELWDPDEPPHTKYPPVFPLLLAFAMLIGARSWIAFKSLSLLFSAVAVLLTFAWVRQRTGGVFLAAGVAVLFALSDALRWSSHWILSEPPFLALTLLALWSFQRVESGSGRGILPSGAAGEDRIGGAEGGGDASGAAGEPAEDRPQREGGVEVGVRAEGAPGASLWLVVGCGAAILAYFTRSAGLPLVLAAGIWLASRQRWRPLALFLAAFGVPAVLWWVRARAVGDPSYISEFWMINPYDPAAGRAGLPELASRVGRNLHLYLGSYFPTGLVGLRPPGIAVAGYLLTALASVGWARRAWSQRTVADFFAPLYFGLILLWPEVWSGDRFALPLYPLLLFYAGDALLAGVRRTIARAEAGPWRRRITGGVGAGAFLLVAAPAFSAWSFAVEQATNCTQIIEAEGNPFACHAASTREFVASAEWSADHLPEGAVVFSRKPRLFWALSGVHSRMFPLDRTPEALAAAAEDGGAEYLVLDRMDSMSSYYIFPILRERPDMFCSITGWGVSEDVMTELLGITFPVTSSGSLPLRQEDAEVLALAYCERSVLRDTPAERPVRFGDVPFLLIPSSPPSPQSPPEP